MSIVAALSPAERQRITRMETTAITPQPNPRETGFASWSRAVAEAVHEALHGTAWRAEARSPYWPHPENETRAELIIAIKTKQRWLRIVHRHTQRAYTGRDLFTLTVNGRPARCGLHRGELPHMPAMIATTVWRHINGYPFGECSALMCDEAPTVAAYNVTMCAEHAHRYANNGH